MTFDGGSAQNINGTLATKVFNNFVVAQTGGLTGAGAHHCARHQRQRYADVRHVVAGTATSINVAGNWTGNSPSPLSAGTGTVIFDGGAGQTIGTTLITTFNNLTNSNASGLAISTNTTVNGVLALTSSDITVAPAANLIMPASGTSSGGFDVVGTVRRTGFVSGGSALSFGNPFNTIKIDSGTAPTEIDVKLTKACAGRLPNCGSSHLRHHA